MMRVLRFFMEPPTSSRLTRGLELLRFLCSMQI